MKKLKTIPFLLVLSGILLVPSFSSAITLEELEEQIKDLMIQIELLQSKIDSILKQPPTTDDSKNPFCYAFKYNLYMGLTDSMTEGEITKLQQFLAEEESIYPEGLITGYFGPLTEMAVKKFQEKHGIVSSGSPDTTGFGVVGPKTRTKIAEICGTSVASNTCTDSDGGIDYYTRGWVTDDSGKKYEDSCLRCAYCPADQINGCKPGCFGVEEYYCENGEVKSATNDSCTCGSSVCID